MTATETQLRLLVEHEEPNLSLLLQMHERASETAREAQRQADELKSHIIALMEKQGHKRMEALSKTGKVYRATYTRPEKIVVDEQGLWADLDPVVYAGICDHKVSKEKLNDAIQTGEIDPEVARKHLTMEKGRASVRFYLVEEGEGDDDGSQS